ncbi:hypothetical protein AF331_03805 [Rossellomorea marisflavi]|uniref:YitT family protein n=1 Tax=Rossellomorea marisflavi TaxID=189381 RepID=A0A0M0GQ51_9BACI|nr:YitT family protein [Rossellomorea marisflavi]KON91637.1 hypothetical protein AF331_03805 [Rossellomorea marisflavi]
MRSGVSIAIGSLLVASGINMFFVPHHFLDGGMIGIGLLTYYWFGLPPGLTIIVLSVPLYAIAFYKDRSLFYRSVHGLWISSLMIDWLHPLSDRVYLSPLACALLGGATVGIGIGLMLRVGAATGGSDLLAQLLGRGFGFNPGKVIFLFDSLVLLAGLSVIGGEAFLHSLVAISTVGFFTTLLAYPTHNDGFSFR